MSWRQIQLGEIATFSNGINFDKTAYASGVPLIGVSNFGNRFTPPYEELEQVKSEIVGVNDYLVDGDIVFVRSNGNKELVGRCMLIKDYDLPLTYSGFCIRCRLKDKSSYDPVFFAYYFKSSLFRKAISGSAVGANIQNLSQGRLASHMAKIPDYFTQRHIAEILYVYDYLIEKNQRQIKLLEEAAQRLYKEWFVDLRFPGHENVKIVDGVPEGWKIGRADDFFDISIGKTPPRAEKQWFVNETEGVAWASISDMGDAGVFIFHTSEGITEEAVEKHNMKVVPAGTILLSFKLTLGRVSITTKPMCTNEAIAHFRIEKPEDREYTYSYLKNFEYDTLGNTSSISKAVNSKIVKAMTFVSPDKEIKIAYSKRVAPILNEIFIKQKQVISLTEARDRLLPKLMSGEIEV